VNADSIDGIEDLDENCAESVMFSQAHDAFSGSNPAVKL